MLLQHVLGFYAYPQNEWQSIAQRRDGMSQSISHLLLLTLIPAVCAYFASTQLGWQIGQAEPVRLTKDSALTFAVSMYLALNAGVILLAGLIHWMGQTFNASPSRQQAFEIAVYVSIPLMMSGLSTLYPMLWFITLIGLLGVAHSVYLLYTGIPLLTQIPKEQGFFYASAIVTAGLTLLVAVLATSAILWMNGLTPVFTH